jgi:hypothetical protein
LLDYTRWIDIPPTQYPFATSPNPVVTTQGEQQDIGVRLKSNNGISAKVVSFIPSQNYSAIKVLVNPDKLNAFSFGIAPAPLRIEAPGNAQIGQYVIPILVNMLQAQSLHLKSSGLQTPTYQFPHKDILPLKPI